MPSVAICICTFRRPVGLASLLQGLHDLELPSPDEVDVRVVVVDNDSAGSARPTVELLASSLAWPITYQVEPQVGIAFARNRAVRLAGDVDFVLFIDDDEVPHADWMAELVRVQRDHGADVVTGPILPRFEVPPPDWVLRGGFFERPRYETGRRLHYARTSSVLVSRPLLAGLAPFDEEIGRYGGEDTHFFMRAARGGALIVWADVARVDEWVPPDRVRVRWLLRRAHKRGNTLSLCLRDLADSPYRRVKRVGRAMVDTLVGLCLIALSVVRGRESAVAGLQRLAFAAGLITGLTGHNYGGRRRLHGP